MKSAIITSLIASAAAFAPAAQKSSSSTSLAAFEDALGAQPPLGLFDPLGLISNGDQDRFDRLRYVEVKHGRVCMLAFLGNIITRAGLHIPGSIDEAGNSFGSYPNGWAAVWGDDGISRAGVYQMIAFVGFLELFVMKDVTGEGEFPGDFRNGFDFGWDKLNPETQLKKRAVELNNGRAAMLGIFGLMVHEQLGGYLPIVGEM